MMASTSGSIAANFLLYLLRISVGISRDLTGFFALLTISLTTFRSFSPARETETPLRPARAVRPTR